MSTDKLNMSNIEYSDYVDAKSKPSPILKNVFFAFIIGGLICVFGEFLKQLFLSWNFDTKTSGTYATIVLIFLGAFLTSIHLYSKLAKFAGAGSLVPITGFSNSIVAPAIEFKSEGMILGLGANMFKIAGPVLVYGFFSSFVIGLIYWIIKNFM